MLPWVCTMLYTYNKATQNILQSKIGSHVEVVEVLLNHKDIDIDKGAKRDEILFYVAAERGMTDIVEILLNRDDYETDLSKTNSNGYTPLYIAACFGHAKCIENMMKHELFEDMLLDIVRFWTHSVLLSREVIPRDVMAIIAMYHGDSSLNKCDKIGRTPFWVTCRKGNVAAFRKLLEYPNLDIHKKDNEEMTPFAAACQGGSVEILETLITMVDQSEINGSDRMQRTPFFMACREGCTEMVKRLMEDDMIIKYNIDINQCDKLERTPFLIAVKRGHNDCVDVLCNNKDIDINKAYKFNKINSQTPLMIAARAGASHSSIITALMNRDDLNINQRNEFGKTALHMACEKGHSSVVMQLLDHPDIVVTGEDSNGVTPIRIANQNLDNNIYHKMVSLSGRH